jgi:hypothetical protein
MSISLFLGFVFKNVHSSFVIATNQAATTTAITTTSSTVKRTRASQTTHAMGHDAHVEL